MTDGRASANTQLGADGALVRVQGLEKHFPITSGIVFQKQVGAIRAVDGVTFDVFRGETLGLVGESGCGKTTAGRTILQLYRPTDGHVYFDGTDLVALKGEDLRRMRKRMQMISQGLIPPSQMTEEELQEMQAKQMMQAQGQAPDAAMLLAQAEQMKAQADMMKVQIDAQKVQNETLKIQLQAQDQQNEAVAQQAKTQVDVFNAQTNRIKAQVEAEKAGAVIDHTNIKAFGDQLDNQEQMKDMMDEQERKARMAMMSDMDLIRIANGG